MEECAATFFSCPVPLSFPVMPSGLDLSCGQEDLGWKHALVGDTPTTLQTRPRRHTHAFADNEDIQ